MNKQNKIPASTSITSKEEERDFLSDIDIGKIIEILWKSIIWVIILNLGTLFIAYLYLRYTKPIYVSNSNLKLTIKNEKSLEGLRGLNFLGLNREEDSKKLAGELEFIRSDIVTKQAIKFLNLYVSYFVHGNILDSEQYENAPYEVASYEIKIPQWYGKRLYVNILDEKKYNLWYEQGNEKIRNTYKFGQVVETPFFKVRLNLKKKVSNDIKNWNYYFIINNEQALINYLKKNLQVGIANRDAKIIALSFQDYTPNKAQKIIEAVDTIYKEVSVEEKNKSNRQKIVFLKKQLEKYEDSLMKYEYQLQNFYLENKTNDIDGKLKKSIEKIDDLLLAKQKLSKKIVLLQKIEGLIRDEDYLKDVFPSLSSLENEQIVTRLNTIQNLKQEQELLSISQKPSKTYRGKEIGKKIALERQIILELIGGEERLLYEQIVEIRAELGEIEGILLGLPVKGREFNRITRLYETYNGYYNSLLGRKNEIEIAEAGIVPDIITLSPASLPIEPISPKKLQVYGIAGVAGVFLSFLLIGGKYLLHNTITNQGELEKIVKVPILGAIPEYKKETMLFTRLVVTKNPKSSLNEALRSIRTNLDFMLPTGGGLYNNASSTVLSVTSTISGEGKTFVASNLGGIIAMSDLKVIILDFDMRKPKLHLAFEAENAQGVSSILIGKKNIQECVQKTPIKTLDFISSGPTPPNPSELILREDFDNLIEDLKSLYDIILIDTPPVGLVTDGILIMKKVDIPIYVVRANYSKKFFGRNVNKLVVANDFQNLAVILNSVKRSRSGYGYGAYGYGGYYGGGYYGGGYYEDEKEQWGSRIKKLFKFKKKRK